MFIMISQSLQGQKDRLRTEMEYRVAMKAQLEIMELHRKMDELPAAILAQVRRSSRDNSPAIGKTPEPEPPDIATLKD